MKTRNLKNMPMAHDKMIVTEHQLRNRLTTALLIVSSVLIIRCGTSSTADKQGMDIKISVVNAPGDIVTVGAEYLAKEIQRKSGNRIQPKVYHSGVLSGGKGEAEIEMCQQGTIEMHITSTAYLANLVPKTSVVSLPFLFRDIDQVAAFTKSRSIALDSINSELNEKNLQIIAWWPRGFRQLTNNKLPVRNIQDLQGLKLRVMNNPLYADNMKAMSASPVPMAWGEVGGNNDGGVVVVVTKAILVVAMIEVILVLTIVVVVTMTVVMVVVVVLMVSMTMVIAVLESIVSGSSVVMVVVVGTTLVVIMVAVTVIEVVSLLEKILLTSSF